MHSPLLRTSTRKSIAFSLVLTFVLFSTTQLNAQDRWQDIDLPFLSGFGSELLWPRPGSEMFWRDSLVGYYYTFDELQVGSGLIYYQTTDRGNTWRTLDSATPIPHRMLTDDVGISPFADISKDGGETWSKLSAEYTDTLFFSDSLLKYTITRSVANDPDHITALYQLHDFDGAAGDSVPFGPFRLAYSENGGSTWRYYDSLLVFGEVLQRLGKQTRFGTLPAPEAMTDTVSNQWWRLVSMVDDSTTVLATKVFGTIDGERTNVYYLGRLDMRNEVASWIELPFTEPIFPPPATDIRLEALSENVIWALGAKFFDVFNDPDSLVWTIWRSENGGAAWDTIEVPSWIDFRSLRFVDESVGIAVNGRTVDGGRTWTRWAHPFENGGLFWAHDSSDYRHVNRFSFFATTLDGGRSWERNAAGGLPLSVSAEDGSVLIGRTYQSLLIGLNNGSAWTDAGLDGGLPGRTHRVWAAAYPDIRFDSNKVVAIATIREYDGSDRMVALQTTSRGEFWSVVQDLPDFGYPNNPLGILFAVDPDQEIRDPVGFLFGPDGLYVTENDGASWEFRNGDIAIESLTMVNTQYGIAVAPEGIYQTKNGGATFTLQVPRKPGQVLTMGSGFGLPNSTAAMFSNQTSGSTAWSVETSQDLGETFTETTGGPADRNMDVAVFWGDSANIHTVGRYGVLQHSGDAGNSFTLENDSSESFRGFVGYVRAGADTGTIYIAGPGNSAARFVMYWNRPASVHSTGTTSLNEVAEISANSVRTGELIIRARPGVALQRLQLYDVEGNRVARYTVGEVGSESIIAIPADGLASGVYSLILESSSGPVHAMVQIIK